MIKISFRDLNCLNSMKKSVCSNFAKMLIISFKDFNTCDLNFLLLWCAQSKKKKKKKTQQRLKNWTSSCSGHSIFCGWSSLEIPSYPLPRPHPWETSTDEMWNMLLIILDDPFAIYMISNDSEITNRKH